MKTRRFSASCSAIRYFFFRIKIRALETWTNAIYLDIVNSRSVISGPSFTDPNGIKTSRDIRYHQRFRGRIYTRILNAIALFLLSSC